MARKTWEETRRRFSAEGEARIEREKDEILLEGNLREIREHLSDLNQTDMGKLFEVSHAVFPSESIRITQFEDIRGQVMGGRRKP